ncbi:20163_t:CDS:2, partial [Racocetra persica]
NEDSISIDLELGKQYSQAKGFSFFGVYDRKKVSEMCSKKLPHYVAKNLDFRDQTKVKQTKVKSAIKKGFEQTKQYLKSVPFSKDGVYSSDDSDDTIKRFNCYSSAFISSNGLSAKITKEHDLHNRLDNISGRGIQYTRSFGDFYIKDKAKNTEPEFINEIYNAKNLDLLVLCSDGIMNQLRNYKRMPTEVLLSYMMQYKNKIFKLLLESACKDLIKLCDSISQSEYCTDDISIIIILFINGRSFKKWHEDTTKNAENSKVWMNLKTTDDEDLSDISEQDLVKPVKNSFFEIYDANEDAEAFYNITVP